MAVGHGGEGTKLFPKSLGQHGAPQQAKGDVGPHRRARLEQLVHPTTGFQTIGSAQTGSPPLSALPPPKPAATGIFLTTFSRIPSGDMAGRVKKCHGGTMDNIILPLREVFGHSRLHGALGAR